MAQGEAYQSNLMTYWKVLVGFFQLSSSSVLIGAVFGFMCSYITKKWRFYSLSAINESTLFICFALFAYFVSELLHQSGIVTLLTVSLVMSHYAFYNLSPQGKEVTYVTFQTLGYISEATVFGFIGISATFYLYSKPICWSFIVAEFFIVIIGRFVGVYFSYYLFEICSRSRCDNSALTFRQLTFIAWAALIRGAIAFALVLQIGDDLEVEVEGKESHHEIRDILESSTCFLVIITTLVFGSLTPLVQRCLLPKKNE